MRTRCPACGGVAETREGTTQSCPTCGAAIEGVAYDPEATVPATRPPAEEAATAPALEVLSTDGPTLVEGRSGVMPPRLNVSLAVLGGPRSGEVIRLERSTCVIGRAGAGARADLEIDDPALSRAHAAVEVLGGIVALRDLGSRNGTFVDGKRVRTATLEDRAEFRLGGTSFMLILTPRDDA